MTPPERAPLYRRRPDGSLVKVGSYRRPETALAAAETLRRLTGQPYTTTREAHRVVVLYPAGLEVTRPTLEGPASETLVLEHSDAGRVRARYGNAPAAVELRQTDAQGVETVLARVDLA